MKREPKPLKPLAVGERVNVYDHIHVDKGVIVPPDNNNSFWLLVKSDRDGIIRPYHPKPAPAAEGMPHVEQIYPGSGFAKPLGISEVEGNRWLVAKHPDGQWVLLAKIPDPQQSASSAQGPTISPAVAAETRLTERACVESGRRKPTQEPLGESAQGEEEYYPDESQAMDYAEKHHGNAIDEAFDAWMAGAIHGQRIGAERERERLTKDTFLEIITEWKFFWMDQRQNSKEDFENYHRRAFGIDANMKHDLANRLARSIKNGKS